MRAIQFFPIILIIALVSILGCSGGGDMPLMPPADNTPGLEETGSQPGDRQEAQDAVEPYAGSHQLWGYYMIEVSDDHQEVNILPMREVAQHFNVLFYLESSPCTNCVKIIDKSFPGGGVIDFLIEMRHPFPGQTNFTGFDVRGIGIFNAHGTFPIHDLKYSIRETGDAEIINADGYTHLYHVTTQGSGNDGLQGYIKGSMSSPQAPDGTLNAYKNFYSSDNRHFFMAGDVLHATYRIDPPQGGFIFGYAVDASWAPAQNQPVVNIPEDFGLNANSPEAYEISVTVSDGLFSDGGTADAEIWVYDWQGFSTIKSVKLEAPDLFGSLIDASFDSLSGNHVIYSATINNDVAAIEGTYDMLIAVEDTANESAPDYLDLTAYQIVEVTVEEGIPNIPPVAIAEADETDIAQGDTVHFDGTASYDPDGTGIFLWEWDLDGDGEYDDVQGFEESIVSWEYLDAGDFDVDLKVYDEMAVWDVLDVKITIHVEADPNIPPVAIAEADETDIAQGDTVHFDGTASYDPDGTGIFLWEWDLDGDGEYDDVQGFEESIVSWEYLDAGDFDVDLKVYDEMAVWDVLDVKITIHVEGDPCAGHTPDAKAKADDYTPNVDEQVKFTDISTDPDGFGDLAYYEWDFTGGAPPSYEPVYDPDSKEVYYTYDEGGDFYVYHRVTDMANCIDELDEPLFVEVNGPPVAAGHADVYEIFSGQQITFYSDATDPDGNGPIENDGYLWDLDANPDTGDDGYEEVGPVIAKIYYGPGIFDIRHKVIDSKGLEDEADPVFQIVVNPLPDVVIHLSEEEAMNPIGAEYDFHNYFGNIGGTSMINYLDFDGPWDFTTIFPNGTFQQDIIDKNHPSVSGYNSNWPSVQYYVFQSGPSSLSGSLTEAFGAMKRSYTDPPDDGVQYTYGIVDITPGLYGTIVFNPWNIMEWPLDKYTNQYDTFDWTPIGVPVTTEVWTTGLGQGTVIIEVNDQEEYYNALLIKVRQRDVEQMFMTVLGDTVSYRWIADDGTELAAITAVNASTNPDNWNVASGLITGTGGIRWLYQFDLGS